MSAAGNGVELMVYAFVMTITPGPNNILLLSSGLNFGLRRTLWHIGGVVSGVLLQMCAVGAGLGALLAMAPRLQLLLKLVGSVYMVWLARQLWLAGEFQARQAPQPIRYHQAVSFQFVNPKAWLMVTTAIAAFVPAGAHYPLRVLSAALLFCLVALPCNLLWAASGARLRHWLRDAASFRRVNQGMAFLAALTVALFWC